MIWGASPRCFSEVDRLGFHPLCHSEPAAKNLFSHPPVCMKQECGKVSAFEIRLDGTYCCAAPKVEISPKGRNDKVRVERTRGGLKGQGEG